MKRCGLYASVCGIIMLADSWQENPEQELLLLQLHLNHLINFYIFLILSVYLPVGFFSKMDSCGCVNPRLNW